MQYAPYFALLLAVFVMAAWVSRVMKQQAIQHEQAIASTQQHFQALLDTYKSELEACQLELEELRAGNIGLGQTVKTLSKQMHDTETRQQSIVEMDPTVKLYNKAAKLIEDGADLKDLVDECGLPRAEAELLMNIHKKRESTMDS